jgi:beta-N-acetylhexosaminidase
VDAIVRAVEDGSLTEERLADAAARVTALSQWLDERPEAFGEADDDERFGLDVARRTISVRGDVRLRRTPFVVDVAGPVSIAAGHRHAHLLDALVADAPGAEVCTLPSGAPESHVDEVLAAAGDRDVVIVVSSRLDPATVANVRTLVAAAPDAVVVSAGSAVEIDATGRGAVDTFGGGRATAVAVAEALGVAVLDDDPNGPPATADGLDHTDSRQRGLA